MNNDSSGYAVTTDAGPFAIVPLWMLQKLNSGPSAGAALSVFVALHKWTNTSRYGYPSHASIAKHAGVSTGTVKRGIKALEDIGALVVVHRWVGADGEPTDKYPEDVEKPEQTSNGYFIRYAMQHSDPTPVQDWTHPSPQICTHPPVQIWTTNQTQLEPDPNKPKSEDDFSQWWSQYPRKTSKATAQTRWKNMTPKQRTAALEALPKHIAHWEITKTGPQFIPMPATWLNQCRWEDELTTSLAKPRNYEPWEV